MGLDMYLNAKKYLWRTKDAEVAKQIGEILEVGNRVKEITIEAAYWRKANHIHAWFLENVQNGEDNCREYDVDRDKLIELLQTCRQCLDGGYSHLLPRAEGFFFGSKEYDEDYWADIKDTAEMLNTLLSDPNLEEFSFTYQSSW